MILGSGRRLRLNSATHPETLQIKSAIASFFCLSSDTAFDSGILPAIPCLMILICVFLSVPILPTSIAFSDYGISPLLPPFVSNYSRSPSELTNESALQSKENGLPSPSTDRMPIRRLYLPARRSLWRIPSKVPVQLNVQSPR